MKVCRQGIPPLHQADNCQFSNTAPQHLANREVLDHFISLKHETDRLGEAITLKKARDSAAARKMYPLERDDPEKKDDPSLFEPLDAEKDAELEVAERRGLSTELVWIQNEVSLAAPTP